ncbi:MAG TPA: exodeoxyribonuclease VII large subunit [Arcobacter sp.]|nr:exodeoxyribonuclease VII large subunit [Arcobacter sp.]HIP55755.1 exodeoxyribonuclease VII large subunit [Arcobacter sp.]
MNSPISVNELNLQINGLLETTFSSVWVEGEISNLTYHNSGHIYFSIKDAKSTISCVMFRGNAQYLKFRLEVGSKIVISGNITVYSPRGTYQLLCSKIEPSGVGALALAYEQLKTKLQIKGYFNKALKKELPLYPKNIYVITSNTGAAIQDMKKILDNRYPLSKMILIPSLVQGSDAKNSIVNSIQIADRLAQNIDESNIIIVGRGGGSIEDLWAFNEEIVADAIYNTKTPIISAVGHESDFVITDLVADVRASTPSNAIEISTPNINDLRQLNDSLINEFNNTYKRILSNKSIEVNNLKKSFSQHSLENRFEFIQRNINQVKQSLNQTFKSIITINENKANLLKNNFKINEPSKKDKIGLVQVTKNNKIIDINLQKIDNMVNLETSKYKFECRIIEKQKILS